MDAQRDLTGRRFGQLTVITRAPQGKTRHRYWVCQCDCGRRYIARGALLLDGTTTRCHQCAAAASVKNRKSGQKADEFALEVYNLAAQGKTQEVLDVAHRRVAQTLLRG